MTLGGQFRTSVRSIRAVGVSPKALSGGGPEGGGSPPRSIEASYMAKQSPNISKSGFLESGFAHPTIYAPHQSIILIHIQSTFKFKLKLHSLSNAFKTLFQRQIV